MPAALLALVLLAAVALGVFSFLRANPTALARGIRRVMIGAAVLAAGLLLIFSIRFLPELLPELMGLAGLAAVGFLTRWVRRWASGGASFGSPSTGQRTEVRTAFLRAWIDHATGDVGGAVLSGRFTGRTLDSLGESELLDLQAEAASDAESARVLEAYLDRRLGKAWRTAPPRPERGPGEMGRAEALAVLGLAEGATAEDIQAAHRRLIRRVHPDVGGSADLAARINRAKDILLGL
jgi:hypothetical protein